MKPTESGAPPLGLRQRLVDGLHNPVQLRALVTILVLLIGYAGVYRPLQAQIDDATRRLAQEHDMHALAGAVEHLRVQHAGFQARLPAKADSYEWVSYVLLGLRQLPLKVVAMNCAPPRPLGPYKMVVLRAEIEGSFFDLDRFLRWLEANPRLFRLESVLIAPSARDKSILTLQVVILGVMS